VRCEQEEDQMIRSTPIRGLLAAAGLTLAISSLAGAQSPGASPGGAPPLVSPPTSLITPGVLTDCVDIEYPPMEYFPAPEVTDPNQAIGFDVDAAREVAATLGLQLEIKNTAFDALIPDLTAGRCDIVWTALYINETRLQQADAVPYMATGQVVMVPAGNAAGIAAVGDLCGKSVSIQSGGLVEERINAASADCEAAGQPPISIQGYPRVADELQQIVLGRVDAVWETDTAVSDWMLKNPGQYEVAFAFPKEDSYGVYFQKGKPDLAAALSAALSDLKGKGVLADIAGQYAIDPVTLEVVEAAPAPSPSASG
jgi:polar amino acid transport system substrate-binding protein